MKKYNFFMVFALSLIPLFGIIGTSVYTYYYGIVWQEPVVMILGWFLSGMGITFGYHRLFAHKSFKAHPIIQFIAMLCGSAALQNNVIKWCSDHRLHHRKLDTEDDPYSITQGFFHAHIGWIIENKPENIEGVNDLENNSILKFQYRYYWPIAIGLSFLLPLIIGFYYGRPFGGLLWGGFLRLTLVHHFTFFINSLCHYVGKRPFESNISARDSWWVAYVTFGEGFHNFHHKFQWDYRNGIRWYDFDPGKWIIKLLSFLKLTTDIRKVDDYKILKARFNSMQNKVQEFLPKTPNSIKCIYEKRVKKLHAQAAQAHTAWYKFEIDFNKIRQKGFRDKFQKKSMYYQRKMLKMEYKSILNAFSLLLMSIKNNI
jgi:stearoyl-CoA desaturase (delta-9 desaturase)